MKKQSSLSLLKQRKVDIPTHSQGLQLWRPQSEPRPLIADFCAPFRYDPVIKSLFNGHEGPVAWTHASYTAATDNESTPGNVVHFFRWLELVRAAYAVHASYTAFVSLLVRSRTSPDCPFVRQRTGRSGPAASLREQAKKRFRHARPLT